VGKIENLIRNYEREVGVKWEQNLAGPQKVWFAVYDKSDERRLRARIGEFEVATKHAGHKWACCDLTDSFAEWMGKEPYAQTYFEEPDSLDTNLGEFLAEVSQRVIDTLQAADVDEQTVAAVYGVASLYGFVRVSQLVKAVELTIKGRLLVFFPGVHEGNTYRFLDARDGWNYLAVPITSDEGARER
jgi:hypothetical protein